MAGMAPLYYGGTHGQCAKLTLYHSLTAWQRYYTAWFTYYGADDCQYFFFRHEPAWIHCSGNIRPYFLVAACSSDVWNGLSFATVVQHTHCSLCGQSMAGGSACWEHYLCHCIEVARLAMGKQMFFLQEAFRVLGISLTLYSMSHHVATTVWPIF